MIIEKKVFIRSPKRALLSDNQPGRRVQFLMREVATVASTAVAVPLTLSLVTLFSPSSKLRGEQPDKRFKKDTPVLVSRGGYKGIKAMVVRDDGGSCC